MKLEDIVDNLCFFGSSNKASFVDLHFNTLNKLHPDFSNHKINNNIVLLISGFVFSYNSGFIKDMIGFGLF
jgi:hypothetical protein